MNDLNPDVLADVDLSQSQNPQPSPPSTSFVGFFLEYPSHPQFLVAAATAALVFFLVSLPQVYQSTKEAVNYVNPNMVLFENNCPTAEGKFLHTLLFFAIMFAIGKIKNVYDASQHKKSNALLAKYAFYGSLLYFFLASSDSYHLSGKLLSGLADPNGCPFFKGLLVHSVVFYCFVLLTCYFPRDPC